MEYQAGLKFKQSPHTGRGGMEPQHVQEEQQRGRMRQLSNNKEASNTVIHTINEMQQKLQT